MVTIIPSKQIIIQLNILNINLQIQKKSIVSTTSRKRAFSGISSVEKAIDKLSKISSENKVIDEFDYFAKSVAVQLKNMPLDRALICQEKLQKVMNQDVCFNLHNKH